MDNLLKQIMDLKECLLKTMGLLNIEKKKLEAGSKKLEMNQLDFWADREQAIKISKEVEDLDKEINEWEELEKEITDLEDLVMVAQKEGDNTIEEDASVKLNELKEKFGK